MHNADTSPQDKAPCLNCGEVLQGAYCHACGQKGGGPGLHFHELVHEIVHEFLHFDSKILRTLKLLLFFPGRLTSEYIAGRRVRYVGPVRLFLVTSIVLFGLLAAMKTEVVGEGDITAADAQVALDEKNAELQGDRFAQAVLHAAKKAIQDPEHLQTAALKTFSKSFFLLVPLFAWVMWRLFAKEQPFYVAHMYFALHFHSFAFIVLSLMSLLTLLHVPSNGVVQAAVLTTIGVYFYLALRRALDASWARTLVRGSVALVVCSALNGVVIGALMITMLFLL